MRPLLLSLLLLPAAAQAWDVSATVEATGEHSDTQVTTVPLGIPIDLFIAEFWVGVSVRFEGTANIGVEQALDSVVRWGDDGEGAFRHELTPRTTTLTLDTIGKLYLDLEVYEGNAASGTPLLAFTLVGDEIPWVASASEDGGLLPDDDPSELELTAQGATFSGVGFSFGSSSTVGVSVQNGLAGEIAATGTLTGETIEAYLDGERTPSDDTLIEVGTPVASIGADAVYTSEVDLSLGYAITNNVRINISVLTFTFPVTIPTQGLGFTIIEDTFQITSAGGERHGLGRAVVPESFDAGEIVLGQAEAKLLLVSNEGEGDLVLQPEASGADASAFTPPTEVTIGAGLEGAIPLDFGPEREGAHAAELVVTTNDPWNPELTVALAGTGVPVPEPPPSDDDDPADETPEDPGCACSGTGGRGPWLAGLVALAALSRRGRRR